MNKISLTIILLIITFKGIQAQEIAFKKGVEIDSALKRIAKVYDVNFAYNSSVITGSFQINRDITVASANEFLKSALSDFFEWNYVGSTILIRVKQVNNRVPEDKVIHSKNPRKPEKRGRLVVEDQKVSRREAISHLKSKQIKTGLILVPDEVELSSFEADFYYFQENERRAEEKTQTFLWQYEAFFAGEKQSRSFYEERLESFYTGLGLSVSVSKRLWYLAASLSYYHLLRSTKPENAMLVDSASLAEDSLGLRPIDRNPGFEFSNGFLKYKLGTGFSLLQNSLLTIPVEVGVSVLQKVGNLQTDYHRVAYNFYLSIPIEYSMKEKSLALVPYFELGFNDDLQLPEPPSRRSSFGVYLSLKL